MFEHVGNRWHHIKHGEAQLTEPRLPMVKLYTEGSIKEILKENAAREEDKEVIQWLRQRLKENEAQEVKLMANQRNLVMLIKLLVSGLKRAGAKPELCDRVTKYLQDNGLISVADCLRGGE